MSTAPIVFDPDLPDISTGQSIIIADIIFTVLIILSTGTRIVSRFHSAAPFGIENYMILLGLTNSASAFNLTTNALEFRSVHSGFGRHLQFLTDAQERDVRRYSQYNILFAILSLWAIKISICFFILGLIRDTHNRSRWILYGLILVTTVGSLIQSVFWGTQAQPLEKLWNPEIPGTHASPTTLVITISLFTAIFSITDLFYAVSPIYFFGRLQMDLKKKLIVIGLTGSGLVVFAVSIVRVAYVRNFFAADFTWALPKVYLFTIFERNLAELIADLPAVYPEIHRRYRQLMKWRKTIGPSQQSIDCGHPDLQNDSQCAIITIGSRETRPSKSLQLSELSKHGEDR
ncbi:hypothetical protein E0Z10_g7010 [Xylaria hypoxylon]|uniref:Rhodopsin domain-containing protein n=1 Tax=Xylaria hypoxylon TaxID=37992 RepID=A0A4Z0YRG1_9PEZI|nr:hypothetical protein E0Z10_g7010 [Xylaria hypoxylon]